MQQGGGGSRKSIDADEAAGTNTLRPGLVVRSDILVAILVVEDEPLLCLDISDALSAKGYEVIAVNPRVPQ
jgi:transposase